MSAELDRAKLFDARALPADGACRRARSGRGGARLVPVPVERRRVPRLHPRRLSVPRRRVRRARSPATASCPTAPARRTSSTSASATTCAARGVGRRLMDFLLERARAAEMQDVFLEVRPSNPVAIRLYESLGFARVGVRKAYYQATGGREDALGLQARCSAVAPERRSCGSPGRSRRCRAAHPQYASDASATIRVPIVPPSHAE